MATVNAVGNSLTGSTGTGSFVGSTSAVLTTPNVGVATATSVDFSNYATGGIIGTSTNNSAASGYVGEYLTGTASGVSLVSNTGKTVVTLSLTAGDWDVFGNLSFVPNASSTIASLATSISLTTDTLEVNAGLTSLVAVFTTGSTQYLCAGVTRMSLSGTTNVYLIGKSIFSISTMTATGIISARRVR